MHKIICNAIAEVISDHKELLKIPLRQKAKFEGWLKFELAYQLEKIGMVNVTVEAKKTNSRARPDISFFENTNYDTFYSIELKTANTNWKSNGITSLSRPITKNIKSIIADAIKLNSSHGIVAFILFPIPSGDKRWAKYIERITKNTSINISIEENCRLIEMNIDDCNKCEILICSFSSKRFNNWL